MTTEAEAADRLLSAEAVRDRCRLLLQHGLSGRLDHFAVDLDRLEPCADEVVATIRAAYPDLAIPFHARWRHFSAGGIDRWSELAEAAPWPDPAAQARAAFDLAIVSVLLDAGAGPDWSYEEGRTGLRFTRSEGLAVASFDLFVSGALSSRPNDPFRIDAEALAALQPDELARGLQVRLGNPIVGLEGRASLLNRLGRALLDDPDAFGRHNDPRPGGLYDLLAEDADSGAVEAPDILRALLLHLGPIWPGRIRLGGLDLGDTWRHPLAAAADASDGLVPFHKLSQWLAYSLIEPLQASGLTVTGIGGLTGLPEYRNGGLFLDTGVLRLTDATEAGLAHDVGSRLVVEWRALTVALLDALAAPIAAKLGLAEADLPLAKVLEGGTWATGRRLAQSRRGGSPPLTVVSDGTVF